MVKRLILGVKLTSGGKRKNNTKKPLENNSLKTKENFTGFYTEDDPVKNSGKGSYRIT